MSQPTGPVPFLDLSIQFNSLRDNWFTALREIGEKGQFILGPNTRDFEKEVAEYLGVKHAIGIANGTDALVLSLRAHGIGTGDEVITTPYTFFATAEAISLVGATPVFADIDADSFNLDAGQIEKYITRRTRAIVPVHLFGQPADLPEIMVIAQNRDLPVFEDAAQAFGAVSGGRRCGAIGDTGCFSFYPTKVLACYGDGGLITTPHDEIADNIAKLRNHGATATFMHDSAGYNSRLDEVQAIVLRLKLAQIDNIIRQRQRVAERYDERFENTAVKGPKRSKNGEHVFNLYTIQTPARDRVKAALATAGIGCSHCYPLPLHLQVVYQNLGYKPGDLPVAEQMSKVCLSLPIYPEMTDVQVDRVADVILGAV